MSDIPAPPSFKSTIIQIKPNDSYEFYNDSDSKNSDAGGTTRRSSKRKVDVAEELVDTGGSKKLKSKAAEQKKRKHKTAHSIIEKKRRTKLNREFEALKILVPACRNSIINSKDSNVNTINDGMYKLTILQATVEYINYLHQVIRLLNQDLTSHHSQSLTDSISFSKLSLNLDNYRNLDTEFNFIEIMKIFKLMGSLNKATTTEENSRPNLLSDKVFLEYIQNKGIKQQDIDNFKLFFDIIEPPSEVETEKSEPRDEFSSKIQNREEKETFVVPNTKNGGFKPTRHTSNNNWKHFSPQISPGSKYLNPSPKFSPKFGSYNPSHPGVRDFQLPSPLLDLPNKNSTIDGKLLVFNGQQSKSLTSQSPLSFSDTYLSFKNSTELFSLSPNSTSNLLQTPKFDSNGQFYSTADTVQRNLLTRESFINEKKQAGEALLQMKRESFESNQLSPLIQPKEGTKSESAAKQDLNGSNENINDKSSALSTIPSILN